jgi:hypothetical protein
MPGENPTAVANIPELVEYLAKPLNHTIFHVATVDDPARQF